jgi:hypothetical protein
MHLCMHDDQISRNFTGSAPADTSTSTTKKILLVENDLVRQLGYAFFEHALLLYKGNCPFLTRNSPSTFQISMIHSCSGHHFVCLMFLSNMLMRSKRRRQYIHWRTIFPRELISNPLGKIMYYTIITFSLYLLYTLL